MAKLEKYLPILIPHPLTWRLLVPLLPLPVLFLSRKGSTTRTLKPRSFSSKQLGSVAAGSGNCMDRSTLNVPSWNWFGSSKIALTPLLIPLTQAGKNRKKRRIHEVQPYSKMKRAGGGPAPEENTKAPCRQPS